MQQSASKLFQKIKPFSMETALPTTRLCQNPIDVLTVRKAKAMREYKAGLDEIEAHIAPNPLMPQPGGKNPLGEFSPYLPPLQIPGIRRGPRPIEEDPIPGSEKILKVRRPSANGPYAIYRNDIGKWHSFVDEHISSCLPALYCILALVILFEPHNLTVKEALQYLWL